MKDRVTLTAASLLSILLFALHWADDVARGISSGGFSEVGGMLILVVWLHATLVLADRRSGLVLVLVLSLLASCVPLLHMRGGLAGGRIVGSDGVFFWVFTLLALGVTAMFSALLSARGLWSLRRGAPR